ncbi:hypothetical protein B566_EDAN010357 [Ephemera danica]|nr:hypothetical protein B566_EDAN010357 [Ephemera danica]
MWSWHNFSILDLGAHGVHRAVTDPRDGRRVALKKLPNVFQSLVSSKRVFRELKMLCFFKHENVSVVSVGHPTTSTPRLLPGDVSFLTHRHVLYFITALLQHPVERENVIPLLVTPT